MTEYPAPRYPRLKRPTAADVRRKIDKLLNPDPGVELPYWPGYGQLRYWPDYGVVKGDKILVVCLSEHDALVTSTLCEALREKGARVDLLTIDSTPVGPPRELASHEAISLGTEEADYNYYYSVMCDHIRPETARAMVKLDHYTKVIAGAAGPLPPLQVPWLRFAFYNVEDYADGGVVDFPPALFAAISEMTWDQVKSCATLRLTDPEGTDVKWTNYDDQRTINPGHTMARPMNVGFGFGGRDDCVGVLAGTTNHMGAYPFVKAHVEKGQVVKVEGGGPYGDAWREKLEIYRNAKLPAIKMVYGAGTTWQLRDRGLFWFFECAIGAEPKVFRLPREGQLGCYANTLHERRRTGFIHCGLGPPMRLTQEGFPWAHVHVHCMFATLEGVTSKGEPVRIIDKGHLLALDDPKIIELASRYGDPKKLLREEWFPAMPGINVAGDYMKDYGKDPVSWITRESKEHPIWVD